VAYDRQFLKVTYGFTVAGTDEIADTSISYSTASGWTGAAAALAEIAASATFGEDALTAFGVLMLDASLNWANYSELTYIKVAAIGTDGAYLADAYVHEAEDPDVGTNLNTLPQATVVLSLRSGFNTGKGNYGRMYLPHTRLPILTTTAKSSSTYTDAVLAAGKTFVNALTGLIGDETTAILFPVIMSQTGITSKGVTALAVGDVTDTQRRRRNRIPELYSVDTLA